MRFAQTDDKGPWFAALFAYQGDYIPNEIVSAVTEWCAEQFGPMTGDNAQWVFSGRVIAFRNEDAAFSFKLRWC